VTRHPPLRNSRTSPEDIRVKQTAGALCSARHKDGHPPDVRRSHRPCDLLTSAPKVVAGQAGHESGRSTVSSRRTAPKSSAIALSSAGTITAVSTLGRSPACHAREPFTPPLRPADWVRTWGAPYGKPHVNRTCYGLLCHRRNGELANRRPSHYPVVGSRKNLSIPIGTLPCSLAPCNRLPTRLHPALRSGTSSVDGCQHRERLTLRPGTPCIDCRHVCTQPCGWAPRLSTVVNTVNASPCSLAFRVLTADTSAPSLAVGHLVCRLLSTPWALYLAVWYLVC